VSWLTSIASSARRWYKRGIAVYQRWHIIVRHTNSSGIEHKEIISIAICPSFANHGFNGIQMIYNSESNTACHDCHDGS